MSFDSPSLNPVHKLALEQKSQGERINLDGEKLQNGIAKLVITLVDVVVEILERQALRRVQDGSLTRDEIERMGMAFMQIRKRTEQVVEQFGFTKDEMNVNLGPLGKMLNDQTNFQQASLVDVIDKLIDQGTMIAGEVTISVANVDLVVLNLLATLSSVQKLKEPLKQEEAL